MKETTLPLHFQRHAIDRFGFETVRFCCKTIVTRGFFVHGIDDRNHGRAILVRHVGWKRAQILSG